MNPKLKVETARTDELIPYVNNAKIHSAEQVDQIAASIEAFGFNDPVGVWTRPDGRLEIVEGHGRIMAAKLLDIEQVPIIRLDHLDDEGRRAYTHVHNQTTLTSGFDLPSLDLELATIPGFDWEDFGFENVSIEGFGTSFELASDDEPQYKTITLGLTSEQFELIQDGDGTIYRASNFVLTGIKKNIALLRLPDGTVVHEMTIKSQPTQKRKELGGRSLFDLTNGKYSMSKYLEVSGAEPVEGFQLRYIYFIDKAWRKRLTVPEIPFSHIDEIGAGMYKGVKR